jgi:hypothetical protein
MGPEPLRRRLALEDRDDVAVEVSTRGLLLVGKYGRE